MHDKTLSMKIDINNESFTRKRLDEEKFFDCAAEKLDSDSHSGAENKFQYQSRAFQEGGEIEEGWGTLLAS